MFLRVNNKRRLVETLKYLSTSHNFSLERNDRKLNLKKKNSSSPSSYFEVTRV